MNRPVLLPFDGTASAELASEHAFEFARRHDATVHALYVTDTTSGRSHEVQESLERRGDSALTSLQRRAAAAGIDVETAIRKGTPHEEIVAYADDEDARTIVMGTQGRSGLDRFVLGSVTERVVRASAVPVLTVGGREGEAPTTDYESVLVPTDGSETAAAALDPALDLARAYDASLHVLHVVDTEAGVPGHRAESDRDAMRERGAEHVAALEVRAREAGFADVTTAVREGRPATTIAAYGDEHDIGCIAMSTHGRTGLGRLLIGSTTERVLRTTKRPVFCIPGQSAE